MNSRDEGKKQSGNSDTIKISGRTPFISKKPECHPGLQTLNPVVRSLNNTLSIGYWDCGVLTDSNIKVHPFTYD